MDLSRRDFLKGTIAGAAGIALTGVMGACGAPEAKVPIVVYFGDYIDNGPEDIMSTNFWRGIGDGALDFAEQYNADGGSATVVDLPKIGITGNSHFMF